MITLSEVNSITGIVATIIGIFFLRHVAVSLKEMAGDFGKMRNLPQKIDESLADLNNKFEVRMVASEKRQRVLEDNFKLLLERLAQHEAGTK